MTTAETLTGAPTRGVCAEALVSPAEARTIAAFIQHRMEDDMMLALNPQATRGQLIRDRFDRLVDEFCG